MMRELDSKVKYKNNIFRIYAIKTEPVKDSKDRIIYCLTDGTKKFEVDEKELKSNKL